jgi:hypothetical protein
MIFGAEPRHELAVDSWRTEDNASEVLDRSPLRIKEWRCRAGLVANVVW